MNHAKFSLFLLGFLSIAVGALAVVEYANFLTIGYEGKGELEFIQPEDLLIGPNNEFIIADSKNNRVQVLTPDRKFQRFITFQPPDSGAGKKGGKNGGKNSSPASPPPKTVPASGTVELPAEIAKMARMDRPVGLAFDHSGNLYVSCAGSHVILVLRYADGGFVRVIGKPGSGQGELREPGDIDIRADGKIAVVDQGNRRVQLFAADGKYLMEKHYREETKKKELRSLAPRGVCWLDSGELLVSYPTFHQVVCFAEADEGVIWRYGMLGNGNGELKEPSYLTVTRTGTIMIADSGNHRIAEITDKGFFLRHLSSRGSNAGRVISPRGIKVNADDFLCVVDQGNNRIQVFQPGKADLILREARVLIEQDKWDDALPKIEQVLNLSPNNPEGRGLLVNALHFFGDRCFKGAEYEKAEEFYRRILMYNPGDQSIQPKLDALFWSANQELITKVAVGLGALIGGLILLWVVKLVFQKLFFSR
jgi:DNA-binding beta-propeller fold protein YncE